MSSEVHERVLDRTEPVRHGIVDVDVHPGPAHPDEIRERMPMPWRDRFRGDRRAFYMHPVHGYREDSKTPGFTGGCSDPDLLRSQLIDTYGVAYAILLMRTFCGIQPDPDFAAAIAAAFNQWLAETWLSVHNPDGAFKGSITIAQQDPLRAAEEIDRWAGHPHFVQATMDSGAQFPFGHRYYHPIYEACVRNDLPIAVHPGTEGMGINHQPTPGWPTHYIEWHCGMSLAFQGHIISLITEGIFERFPTLRFVFVEGGVAWLAPMMWRLDAYWKALRIEVPWVKRLPSEYIHDHMRFGTQPLERPDDDRQLLQVFDMIEADRILMFSSDYPHWDFDSPDRAFPKLTPTMRDAIFSGNARELYGLG